jgi:hypothetical protein
MRPPLHQASLPQRSHHWLLPSPLLQLLPWLHQLHLRLHQLWLPALRLRNLQVLPLPRCQPSHPQLPLLRRPRSRHLPRLPPALPTHQLECQTPPRQVRLRQLRLPLSPPRDQPPHQVRLPLLLLQDLRQLRPLRLHPQCQLSPLPPLQV